METPLFLPPYSALESHQPRLGIEGGGGTDGVDAESRSEKSCVIKGPFFSNIAAYIQ